MDIVEFAGILCVYTGGIVSTYAHTGGDWWIYLLVIIFVVLGTMLVSK